MLLRWCRSLGALLILVATLSTAGGSAAYGFAGPPINVGPAGQVLADTAAEAAALSLGAVAGAQLGLALVILAGDSSALQSTKAQANDCVQRINANGGQPAFDQYYKVPGGVNGACDFAFLLAQGSYTPTQILNERWWRPACVSIYENSGGSWSLPGGQSLVDTACPIPWRPFALGYGPPPTSPPVNPTTETVPAGGSPDFHYRSGYLAYLPQPDTITGGNWSQRNGYVAQATKIVGEDSGAIQPQGGEVWYNLGAGPMFRRTFTVEFAYQLAGTGNNQALFGAGETNDGFWQRAEVYTEGAGVALAYTYRDGSNSVVQASHVVCSGGNDTSVHRVVATFDAGGTDSLTLDGVSCGTSPNIASWSVLSGRYFNNALELGGDYSGRYNQGYNNKFGSLVVWPGVVTYAQGQTFRGFSAGSQVVCPVGTTLVQGGGRAGDCVPDTSGVQAPPTGTPPALPGTQTTISPPATEIPPAVEASPSTQVTTQPSAPSGGWGLGDVVSAITTLGDTIVNGLLSGLKYLLDIGWGILRAILRAIQAMTAFMGQLLNGLQVLLGQVWAGLDGLLRFIYNGLIATLQWIGGLLLTLQAALLAALQAVVQAVLSLGALLAGLPQAIATAMQAAIVGDPTALQTDVTATRNAWVDTAPGRMTAQGTTLINGMITGANTGLSGSACGPTIGFDSVNVSGHAALPGFQVRLPSAPSCPGNQGQGNQDSQAYGLFGYLALVRGLVMFALLLGFVFQVAGAAPWSAKSERVNPGVAA